MKKKTPDSPTKYEKVEKQVPRSERASAFLEAFNKKMKGRDGSYRAQLKSASDYDMPWLAKRLPTGLLQLDVELRGGFPAGGLSQIVGPKNSCKSYIYWQVIRQLQYLLKDKMSVLLAMTEMKADKDQARKAGVEIAFSDNDIDSLDRARSAMGNPRLTKEERASYKTQIGTIHELHGESAEYLYDCILAGVEQNFYHLIVIDSFGSIMSAVEAESESLTEKQFGGAAAVNTKFIRKLTALLTMNDSNDKSRDVCIIGINQVRDAIGDRFKEYKSTGGRALEHAKFVDLYVSSGKLTNDGKQYSIMTPSGIRMETITDGKEINWKIEKGKAGIHEGGKGTFEYNFNINQADHYKDALIAGVRSEIIDVNGAYYGLKDQSDSYVLRCNGKEAFCRALAEDAIAKQAADNSANSFLNMIRTMTFAKKGISIDYEWAAE